jgi:hypothetical protein
MGGTAFLGRPWLAGPPGANLRLITARFRDKQKATRSKPNGLRDQKSVRAETSLKSRCRDPGQSRLRVVFTFKRSAAESLQVCSRGTLIVDQANSAAPLSVLARRGIGIGQRPTLDELHAQPLPFYTHNPLLFSASELVIS